MTEARNRAAIAASYLELAEVAAAEAGPAINTSIGNAVLAGIAAGDAICLAAIGERYAGQDHNAAPDFLEQVDPALGRRLRTLVGLKTAAHYGDSILTGTDRTAALRQASALIAEAKRRTT
ncbi:MAG: hypothetical protein IPL41_02245 [Micropruina sp.]|nr:hypothetical protein [Micropruina sp.]